MLMNATGNEPVITSYAQASTRTVSVGGTTYAYRELGRAYEALGFRVVGDYGLVIFR